METAVVNANEDALLAAEYTKVRGNIRGTDGRGES